MELIVSVLAGVVTGLLSGWGLGGGTLLLIWLSLHLGIDQVTAQGINLLYFLPCSAVALLGHIRNGLVERQTALPAIGGGILGTALGAILATILASAILRHFYGLFLLTIGIMELFWNSPSA